MASEFSPSAGSRGASVRASPPTATLVDQLVLAVRENLSLGWRAGGYHECDLDKCARGKGMRVVRGIHLGSWLLWVRHPRKPATLFCAPNLVLHSVLDLRYRPAVEFVEAILAFRPGDLPIDRHFKPRVLPRAGSA